MNDDDWLELIPDEAAEAPTRAGTDAAARAVTPFESTHRDAERNLATKSYRKASGLNTSRCVLSNGVTARAAASRAV
jgi:hypothetical protein